MKVLSLAAVVFAASTAEAFVTPSTTQSTAATTTTKLNAYAPRIPGMGNNAEATPIVEDKKAPLTKIKTKYRARDGSVILGHDFRLTMEIATVAPLIYYGHGADMDGTLGMFFHIVLAAWIGVQANRVRGVFDKQAIEFYNLKGAGVKWEAKPAKCDDRLQRKPNNWMVHSTPNRWNYETITGYYFYPSLEFPVVTVLWETQTTPNAGEQPHFFPCLFDAKQFKEEMDKHNVPYKLPWN